MSAFGLIDSIPIPQNDNYRESKGTLSLAINELVGRCITRTSFPVFDAKSFKMPDGFLETDDRETPDEVTVFQHSKMSYVRSTTKS